MWKWKCTSESVKVQIQVQVQMVSVQSSKMFSFCLKLLLLLDFSLFSFPLRGEMHAKPLFREMALFLNKHLASPPLVFSSFDFLPWCFSTLIFSSLGASLLPWWFSALIFSSNKSCKQVLVFMVSERERWWEEILASHSVFSLPTFTRVAHPQSGFHFRTDQLKFSQEENNSNFHFRTDQF